MVYEKSMLRMQLQDYIKSMMLDFITKRINLFNFKLFKIVLLATINSIIVTASLLLNLYTVLLLKIYYQIRKLDILIKHTIISRNIAFERVKWLKRRYLKAIQFFGSSQEVDCLNSLVSHFFFRKKKKMLFQFLLILKIRKMLFACCIIYLSRKVVSVKVFSGLVITLRTK